MNKSWCNIHVLMNDESLTPDAVNYCFISDGVVVANFCVREEFRTAGAADVMVPKWEHMVEAFESSPTIVKTDTPIMIGSLWDGTTFTSPVE